MNESKIVILWPGARYWRETALAVPVVADMNRLIPHAATCAYSVNEAGTHTVRVWWVYTSQAFLDGYDPPRELHESPAFKFVDTHTVKVGAETPLADFIRNPARGYERFANRPARLLDRWAAWERKHKIRVIHARSKWQTRVDHLKTRIAGKWRRALSRIMKFVRLKNG